MKQFIEPVKDRLNRLNGREKIIVTLGVSATIVFLFLQYGFLPKISQFSQVNGEVQTKKQDVQLAQAEGVSLAELQQEYKRITEKISSFEAKIPKETKADLFVNDLTRIASENQVHIQSIKSGAITKEGEYTKFSIELSVFSVPDQLLKFLDILANIPRLISIKEFDVSAEESQVPQVSARLLVATYSIE